MIQTRALVTVIILQVLKCCAYNLQHTDSNDGDITPVQTITLDNYSQGNVKVNNIPNDGSDFAPPDQTTLDTWSVVWYIASFGGLILFFLIVSCSEWCCRRNARRNCQRNSNQQTVPQVVPDTPPPSYDLFAPPPYEDLWVGSSRGRSGEKSEYDIYVVPVHALGTIIEDARQIDAPPSYQSASAGFAHPSDLPQVHQTLTTPTRVT